MSEPAAFVRKTLHSTHWSGQSCSGPNTIQHNGDTFGGAQHDRNGTEAVPSSDSSGSNGDCHSLMTGHSSPRSSSSQRDTGATPNPSGDTQYRMYIDGVGVEAMHGDHAFTAGSTPKMKQRGRVFECDWKSKYDAKCFGKVPRKYVDLYADPHVRGSIHLLGTELDYQGKGGGETTIPKTSVSGKERYRGRKSPASQQREETTAPPCTRQLTYAERHKQGAEVERERDFARRLKELETRERDLETRVETLQFAIATHDMADVDLRRRIADFRSEQASVQGGKASSRSGSASTRIEAASAGTVHRSVTNEQGSSKLSESKRKQLQREAALRQNLPLWRSQS